MRGCDCGVKPEWWPLGMVPLEQANAAHARRILSQHRHECVRRAAAEAYLQEQDARRTNESTDPR